VLVRRSGGASAVRRGRFAEPDRRAGAGHLVPRGGAARPEPRGPDAGRPSWRPPGHHGHPARLIPYARTPRPLALPGGGPLSYSPTRTPLPDASSVTAGGNGMRLGLALGYWGRGPDPGQLALVQEAERLGYDSVWTAEAWGSDAFTPLTWIAAH